MMFKPLYDINGIKDLKDMLEQSVKLFGTKNAFLLKGCSETYKGITYAEFKDDVDALGTALTSLGLRDGRIAVIGENRYEWCVTYLAVANGTGVIVPLDKELPPAELENLLLRSGASAIVYSGRHETEMKRLAAVLPAVRYFINMDSESDAEGFLSFRLLVEKGRKLIGSGDRSFLDAGVDAEKMSMLIFTSGTTDLAKGVMLSHGNICADIMSIGQGLYIDERDSVLSILPLHHTYECTTGFLFMLYRGCTISFNEGLKHIVKNLKEVKPTALVLVPLILENMYKRVWEQAAKNGEKSKLKLGLFISKILINVFRVDIRKKLFKKIHENLGGNVRLIISGAAALNPDVAKGLQAMGFRVLQGYGLTECSPVVSVNREDDFRNDSIGQPLPGVEVRIDSADENGIGEIAVKSSIVMLGYYENPLATEKVLRDGWLYTGDLGTMDSRGFIRITGRKKNVIVTKNGKNIFPEEVEAYLGKSPYILEALIWGRDDAVSGETLVEAQIVPDFDAIREKLKLSELSDDEVYRIISSEVKSINRMMPLYKRIRRFTIREEEFAKTTTKKIKRYVEKTG